MSTVKPGIFGRPTWLRKDNLSRKRRTKEQNAKLGFSTLKVVTLVLMSQSFTKARQLGRVEFDHVGHCWPLSSLSYPDFYQRPSVSFKSPPRNLMESAPWRCLPYCRKPTFTQHEVKIGRWMKLVLHRDRIHDISIYIYNISWIFHSPLDMYAHETSSSQPPQRITQGCAIMAGFGTHPAPKCMLGVPSQVLLALLCLFRFEPFGSGTRA